MQTNVRIAVDEFQHDAQMRGWYPVKILLPETEAAPEEAYQVGASSVAGRLQADDIPDTDEAFEVWFVHKTGARAQISIYPYEQNPYDAISTALASRQDAGGWNDLMEYTAASLFDQWYVHSRAAVRERIDDPPLEFFE